MSRNLSRLPKKNPNSAASLANELISFNLTQEPNIIRAKLRPCKAACCFQLVKMWPDQSASFEERSVFLARIMGHQRNLKRSPFFCFKPKDVLFPKVSFGLFANLAWNSAFFSGSGLENLPFKFKMQNMKTHFQDISELTCKRSVWSLEKSEKCF